MKPNIGRTIIGGFTGTLAMTLMCFVSPSGIYHIYGDVGVVEEISVTTH